MCSVDIAIANPDRKSFAFMRSIPNFNPLSETGVRAEGEALMPLAFNRVYSHHFERVIYSGAKLTVRSSVERYVGYWWCLGSAPSGSPVGCQLRALNGRRGKNRNADFRQASGRAT